MNDKIEIHSKGWTFTRVPNTVLKDSSLTSADKIVFVALCYFADQNGLSFPSYAKIAEIAGYSRRHTISSVNTLIDKGYLLKETRRTGYSNSESNVFTVVANFTPSEMSSPPGEYISPPSAHSSPKLEPINESHINNTSLEQAKKWIQYLNEKAEKSYRLSSQTSLRPIKARIGDGFSEAEMKRVVDYLTAKWKGDPKMDQYLRPQTVFGPKFESYLNAAPPPVAPMKPTVAPEYMNDWIRDQYENK